MWCLTTVTRDSPDPYTDRILPLTEPLFIDYAERWGMAYRPIAIDRPEEVGFERIRTRGTQAVYASIPKRRALLSWYDGVIYLDEDAVIVSPQMDLRTFVTDEQPVAMLPGLSGAVQILKRGHYTRDLLQKCWDERDHWVNMHWAEEGFFKHTFGWDPWFEHGEPSVFVKATPDTDRLAILPDGIVLNPAGVHPFEHRLECVKENIRSRKER